MNKLLCLIALVLIGATSAKGQYTSTSVAQPPGSTSGNSGFISFDYGGGTDTEGVAITPSGTILARYNGPDGSTHAVLLRNGVFSPFEIAGSTCGPGVAWINSSGAVTGTYCSNGGAHAYILKNGVLTTIDATSDPTMYTVGFGISDAGDVVGPVPLFADFFQAHGFLYSHGQTTLFDFPGASTTIPTMILDPQRIVGTYLDKPLDQGGIFHGFLLANGQATTIDFPNSTFTWITGINPSGDVVGFYVDQNGSQHGFVLSQGKFTSVDIPGGTNAEVNGIDPQGNLVGRYSTAGITHGYYLPRPY